MVTIKANKSTGEKFTPYANNAEFAYMTVECTEIVFDNGWAKEKKRTAIVRGATSMISLLSQQAQMKGRIAVVECLESNIPAKFTKQFNKEKTFEENIKPFLKTAGEGGPLLVVEGERILRFTEYDSTESINDVRVAHTNYEDIKAYNTAVKNAEAELPE